MRLYQLKVNGETLVEVEIDAPAWLPVRPRLNPLWLRSMVSSALRRYLETRVVRA